MVWIIIGGIFLWLLSRNIWVGLICFIILLIYRTINTRDKNTNNTTSLVDKKVLPADDVEFTDAERIRALVQKKRNLAQSKGLDDLFLKIFEETQYFSSWIKQNRDYVPSIVLARFQNDPFSNIEPIPCI